MLLFRSLTTGLIAACFVLLAMARPRVVALPTSTASAATPVSIVDVAGGVPTRDLAALIHLRPGEAVAAVGDRAVGSDLAAGAAIASLPARRGSYVDVTIAGSTGERRVLLLLH